MGTEQLQSAVCPLWSPSESDKWEKKPGKMWTSNFQHLKLNASLAESKAFAGSVKADSHDPQNSCLCMTCQWRNLSSLCFPSSCTSRVELNWHLTQNPDASMFYTPWPSPAGNPRVFFACLKLNSADTQGVSVILIQVISGMWKMKAGVPALVNIDWCNMGKVWPKKQKSLSYIFYAPSLHRKTDSYQILLQLSRREAWSCIFRGRKHLYEKNFSSLMSNARRNFIST